MQQHPDATRAIIAALGTGAVAGVGTAMGKQLYGESRGQKRMRVLRNALLAAGLGGGATAALQAGAHQLSNALPANAADPVQEQWKGIRNTAGDLASSLPSQLFGAHRALKLNEKGEPIADKALRELADRLTTHTPPAREGSPSFTDYLLSKPETQHLANDMSAANRPMIESLKAKWMGEHGQPGSGKLMSALSGLPSADGAMSAENGRSMMNRWFSEGSIFNGEGGKQPKGPHAEVQKLISEIAAQNMGTKTEGLKELMRRAGVNYRTGAMPSMLNWARGKVENLGIPTGMQNGLPIKPLENVGQSAHARGAAGLAGGLLIPGLIANLARGEFRGSDYLPDLGFPIRTIRSLTS